MTKCLCRGIRRLRVGDLLMSGGADPISRAIQIGTRSRYSHVGIVTGPDQVTEAFDYALTPSELDEGLYCSSLQSFFDRSRSNRVRVRRPTGVDPDRLADVADHIRLHSPAFPSMGVLFLALCGLSEPALRRLPESWCSYVVGKQVRWAADGTNMMHCAEAATRIYASAGLPIHFPTPRLQLHLQRLSCERSVEELNRLPGLERIAERGSWPSPSQITGIGHNMAFAVNSAAETIMARIKSSNPFDWADLTVPADFANAEPFTEVTEFVRCHSGWRELR